MNQPTDQARSQLPTDDQAAPVQQVAQASPPPPASTNPGLSLAELREQERQAQSERNFQRMKRRRRR